MGLLSLVPVQPLFVGLYGGFKAASFVSTAVILLQPADPMSYGIWAVFLTSAASVLTNWCNNRARLKEMDRKHQWEVEDRRLLTEKTDTLQRSVNTNTVITLEASAKADQAYSAANHVNEKIAKLGLEKAVQPVEDVLS